MREELGRGGMGTVRLAEDPELGRDLAIKFLLAPDADAAEQFLEEAQITAQLEHPNIVPIHELGRDAQGRPWLAMKRIAGQSLAEVIDQWKADQPVRLAQEDLNSILTLFGRICDAVSFAHSRGVIHRDLKAQNVMVGEYGEVLVVDWGLAKPLGSDSHTRPVKSARRADGQELTLDGDVFGTPAYMSPEQAEGRIDEIDERADVFSLGGVLYHMLTCQPPYSGRSASEIVARAARHQLVSPARRAPDRAIPRELDAIVMKAMAKEVSERYSSVADLQADLAAFQSYRPTTAWHPGPVARLVKWTRRHPRIAQATVLLLLSGLVVALLVSQLQVAQQAAEVAETREQLATAQRDQAKRDLVVSERRRETAEGRAKRIGSKVSALLSEKSKKAKDEFVGRWTEARASGITDDSFATRVSPEDARRYLSAFDEYFDVLLIVEAAPTRDELFYRALIRQCLSDLPGAIRDMTAALQLDPGAAGILMNRAFAKDASSDSTGALLDADRAVQLEPGNPLTRVGRANLRRRAGRLDVAREDLDEAARLSPDNPVVLNASARLWIAVGDKQRALNDLDRAITLAPNDSLSLYQRGLLHQQAGRLRESLSDYDQAIRVDPSYVAAFINRANVRQALGSIEGAMEDLAEAHRLSPSNFHVLSNHANMLRSRAESNFRARRIEAGRTDAKAAIALYEESLALDGSRWEVWANLGVVNSMLSRDADAAHAFQRAYPLCTDPAARRQLAEDIVDHHGTVPE